MSAPSDEDRALRSVCYDVTVIETPWPGHRWCQSASDAHADLHRRLVRSHLIYSGTVRLPLWNPRTVAA